MTDDSTSARTVTREEWLAARKALLEKEKALTRARDELNAARLALPRVRVEKEYRFDTPDGPATLSDLFDGRSQLIVQHFMFAPDWEEGCLGCSFGADHANAAWMHLKHHDVSYVAVARARLDKLQAYWNRMGWDLPVASSLGSDFNYDFGVSFTADALAAGKVIYNYEETDPGGMEELPGASVFHRDADGAIYHTYSVYGRGGEEVLSTYMLLDMTPKGRNETGPNFNLTDWVRRHDEYPPARGTES